MIIHLTNLTTYERSREEKLDIMHNVWNCYCNINVISICYDQQIIPTCCFLFFNVIVWSGLVSL